MEVYLKFNDKLSNGEEVWALCGNMPWIVNEVDEKIQNALGME